MGDYTIFFSGTENLHNFGLGFAVHKTITRYVKELNLVSEQISMISFESNPINICTINSDAPTKVSDDEAKKLFYEKLTTVYEKISGNVIKIVLGDLNTKYGRETQYVPAIGRESTHGCSNDNSNDNRKRLI